MRKVLAILIIAGLLVLALSMPALARTEDPAKNFGQLRSASVQDFHEAGIPPGSNTSGISYLAHLIKTDEYGGFAALGIYNVGDYVAFVKATEVTPK